MAAWTTDRFRQFEPAIRKLVEQHEGLKDEPFHLAIAYKPAPTRDQQDIYLLEVIGGGLDELVSSERELFETTFLPTPNFPTGTSEKLHLVLTSPKELTTAIQDGWPSLQELLDAVRSGEYRVLHSDETGTQLLNDLRTSEEPVAGRANG